MSDGGFGSPELWIATYGPIEPDPVDLCVCGPIEPDPVDLCVARFLATPTPKPYRVVDDAGVEIAWFRDLVDAKRALDRSPAGRRLFDARGRVLLAERVDLIAAQRASLEWYFARRDGTPYRGSDGR
jgi:hypothetical protein